MNAKNNLHRYTAFHVTYKNGHLEIAELLMQKSTELNIKLNAKDKCEWTAFHLAYKNGRLGIIELLIQKCEEFNIEISKV